MFGFTITPLMLCKALLAQTEIWVLTPFSNAQHFIVLKKYWPQIKINAKNSRPKTPALNGSVDYHTVSLWRINTWNSSFPLTFNLCVVASSLTSFEYVNTTVCVCMLHWSVLQVARLIVTATWVFATLPLGNAYSVRIKVDSRVSIVLVE